MEHDMILWTRPEYDLISGIFREEEQYFRECHHRDPVGRAHGDAVDNAWSLIRYSRGDSLSYIYGAGVNSEMRCDHAGC